MRLSLAKPGFNKEYFLLLLPLFFVLHGFTENFPLVHLSEIAALAGIYIFSILLFTITGYFVFKNWRKASIFSLFIFSFYFFFGALHDALKNLLDDFFITRYVFIIPAVIIGFFLLFFYIKKNNKKYNRLTNYANVLLLILILVDGFSLTTKNINSSKKASQSLALNNCDTCYKPDIYLIVADEYAGNHALKYLFDYDNSGFNKSLQNRGFYVIDSSVSNYNYTFFSIASMLQMQYLQGIEGMNSSKKDRNLTYKIINQNNLVQFLKSNGYEIKNYSVFSVDDQPVVSNSVFFKTGKDLVTSQTFFGRLDRDIRFNLITKLNLTWVIEDVKNKWLQNITTIYDATWKEASLKSQQPKFVYTHLMMPHYPYFFKKDGRPNDIQKVLEGHQTNKKDYVEYLQYSNKKFLQLVDHILSQAKKPPVIIFVSDHGFRHYNNANNQYQFQNFAAIYLPGKDYEGFYNGLSNVNLFRLLLNKQFNQNLNLLKDSSSFLVE